MEYVNISMYVHEEGKGKDKIIPVKARTCHNGSQENEGPRLQDT